MVGATESVIPENYEIKPLNAGLRKYVEELGTVLSSDYRVRPDPKRTGFYDVIAGRTLFYVRVNEPKIYLVWRAGNSDGMISGETSEGGARTGHGVLESSRVPVRKLARAVART